MSIRQAAYCLHLGQSGSKRDAEQIQSALLNRGRQGNHIEDGDVWVYRLNSVFDDRCQVADQSLKAVDFDSIGSLLGRGLELGGGGALGGSDDRCAGGLGLDLVIVIEQDRGQQL